MAKIEFYQRRQKAPAQMDVDSERNRPKQGEKFLGAEEKVVDINKKNPPEQTRLN